MFDHILNIIKHKVSSHKYFMTLHAEEEMNDDGLTIFDIECCLLKGAIRECQKDKITGERKYLVRGINIREVTKNNLPILLVFLSVFCVANMDEYVQYSSIFTP